MIEYNSRDGSNKTPFGAVEVNTTITFRIHNRDKDKPSREAYLVISNDAKNQDEQWIGGNKHFMEEGDYHWEEYEFQWSSPIPGLFFYGFKIFYWDDTDESKGSYQLTVYEEDVYGSPEWMRDGLMYQIFPDRFAKSSKYSPPEQNKIYYLRDDWGGTPYGHPDENGIVWNNDFFGGNLQGIIERLDYLESLGVTVIYLNPIFEAFSNHRYDTGNYMTIDPLLGNEEIFRELCEKAMEKGIRVILDGVFNHTGSDSIYFNKTGRFKELGAFQSRDAKYFEWYNFIEYPHKYEAWWGIDTLPSVNEHTESFREYILTGEDSVIKHWLRCGASGFRLDVADELPDIFLDELRMVVKEEKPDVAIIGEVWEDASNKVAYGQRRRYFQGKQLDSVMNYPLKNSIINFVTGNISGYEFSQIMESLWENYPEFAFYSSMNILGTHDTSRILTVLKEHHHVSGDREAIQKLFLALLIWAFMPGIPCIYYGDEIGMEGGKDPLNRGCFRFEKRNEEIFSFYKRLLMFRKTIKNLGSLTFEPMESREDYFAFSRYGEDYSVLVVINRGHEHSLLKVDLLQEETIYDFFISGQVSFDGKRTFNLQENSGIIVYIKKIK